MIIENLVAQVTANAPECPAYKINGYLLELLEKMRLEGSRDMIRIDTSVCDPARYAIQVPSDVMQVHKVWLNGREVRQSLREADVVYDDEAIGAQNLWEDPYDNKIFTDYDGKQLELII